MTYGRIEQTLSIELKVQSIPIMNVVQHRTG